MNIQTKVYVVMRLYDNYCEVWETIHKIFSNPNAAAHATDVLNELNDDSQVGYFAYEWDVE